MEKDTPESLMKKGFPNAQNEVPNRSITAIKNPAIPLKNNLKLTLKYKLIRKGNINKIFGSLNKMLNPPTNPAPIIVSFDLFVLVIKYKNQLIINKDGKSLINVLLNKVVGKKKNKSNEKRISKSRFFKVFILK